MLSYLLNERLIVCSFVSDDISSGKELKKLFLNWKSKHGFETLQTFTTLNPRRNKKRKCACQFLLIWAFFCILPFLCTILSAEAVLHSPVFVLSDMREDWILLVETSEQLQRDTYTHKSRTKKKKIPQKQTQTNKPDSSQGDLPSLCSISFILSTPQSRKSSHLVQADPPASTILYAN